MRERITLVHRPGAGPDPEALSITKSGLRAAAPVEAVREDRLTLALDGLPHELAQLLQDFDGLRVRWASSAPYQTLEPLSSRLSPGLHVSYTRKADGEAPYDPYVLSHPPLTLCSKVRHTLTVCVQLTIVCLSTGSRPLGLHVPRGMPPDLWLMLLGRHDSNGWSLGIHEHRRHRLLPLPTAGRCIEYSTCLRGAILPRGRVVPLAGPGSQHGRRRRLQL